MKRTHAEEAVLSLSHEGKGGEKGCVVVGGKGEEEFLIDGLRCRITLDEETSDHEKQACAGRRFVGSPKSLSVPSIRVAEITRRFLVLMVRRPDGLFTSFTIMK